MDECTLRKRRRNLPHWTIDGSTYFVTFRLKQGTLTAAERKLVIEHLKAGHGKYYQLTAAVIMPDHVHLLLRPENGFELPRIMKGIKGVSARLIITLGAHQVPFGRTNLGTGSFAMKKNLLRSCNTWRTTQSRQGLLRP